MRKITTLLVLFLALNGNLYAQEWKMLPYSQPEQINGIQVISEDTAIVVTAGGMLSYTYDGGQNWRTWGAATGKSLEDLSFYNSQLGWVCGSKGLIMRTTDGGQHWVNKSIGDTIPWFFDIEMLDETHGLAIGLNRHPDSLMKGFGVRTTDGGTSWLLMEPIGAGYSEIFYKPGNPVYFLSYGKVNYSKDFGETWEWFKTTDGQPARALSFKGSSGLICGMGGMAAFTTNGGHTWFETAPSHTTMFVAAQLIDDSTGYIGGTDGAMYRTNDAGHTWVKEELPKQFDIFDLYLYKDMLWAVGSYGSVAIKKVK